MKTLVLGFVFSLNLLCISAQNPTIILINGIPHLVVLGENQHILETIQTVPYYLSSHLTHAEIVAGLVDQMSKDSRIFYAQNEDRLIPKDEVDILENAEFIKFIPDKALLNRIAVDRIRAIADDYVDGGIAQLSLDIIYKSTRISDLLTDNRLSSVRDLLVAFGVDKFAIETKKELRDDLGNNPFVRIRYKKDLR
jgi:hypothetical protein